MKFIDVSKQTIADFVREDDGAQIVEYGLIIAAVSLGLITLLTQLVSTSGGFNTFVSHVGTWLSTGKAPA
jgi:pilus assembly protein Flp/PilA